MLSSPQPRRSRRRLAAVAVAVALVTCGVQATLWGHPDHQLDLIATKPARRLQEDAYPIGNGYLGALVMAGVEKDELILSEHTLWDGIDPANPGAIDFGNPGRHPALATLTIETGHDPQRTRTFMRRLDLQTATVEVTYRHDRTRHEREYFCSHPDHVLAARFRANRKGEVNLTFAVGSSLPVKARFDKDRNRLMFDGLLAANGLAFQLGIEVRSQGGVVRFASDRLHVEKADEVSLFVVADTSFGEGKRVPQAVKRLDALRHLDVLTLRRNALPDYQQLFHSMYLTIDGPSQINWTTEKRLAAYAESPESDLGLEELLFQYARYLMIAASRGDSLPAHHRGRWIFPASDNVDNNYEGLPPFRNYAGVWSTQLDDCGKPVTGFRPELGSMLTAPVVNEREPSIGNTDRFATMRRLAMRGDGDGAYALLREALQKDTSANLLVGAQNIGMQYGLIDALSLMLARVDPDGGLHLCPALPRAWPDGSFVGLRPGILAEQQRYEVAAAWREGELLEAYLTHLHGGECRLLLDPSRYAVLRHDEPLVLERDSKGLVSFEMERDETYVIRRDM